MRITNFIGLMLFAICLFSCSKQDENVRCENDQDFSHFEGNFYVNYQYLYNYQDSYRNENSDLVLSISVENDSLKIFNMLFPIESESQTSFIIDSMFFTDAQWNAELHYFNDYDSISFIDAWMPFTESPSETDRYNGVRTELEVTSSLSSHHDEVAGEYNLVYDFYHYSTGISEDRSNDYEVERNGSGGVNLGEYQFYFQNFHSWAYGISSFPSLDTQREYELYLWEDSLYIEQEVTSGFGGQPEDTIIHLIHGVKTF